MRGSWQLTSTPGSPAAVFTAATIFAGSSHETKPLQAQRTAIAKTLTQARF
jgi:hypothetical protein